MTPAVPKYIDSGSGLKFAPGLLSVGHEKAPMAKPGYVTQRFLLSVWLFPRKEPAFVACSPTVAFPWFHAIRNSLRLL